MYDGIGDGIYMVAAVVIDLVEEKKYCHRCGCEVCINGTIVKACAMIV